MKKITILLSVIFITSCSSSKITSNDGVSRVLKTGDVMEMNSEEFLVSNNTWQLKTTDHFRFFFDKSINSDLQQDVIKSQELNYTDLMNLMNLDEKELIKINFWLFKDRAQKKLLTTVDTDAHVISSIPSVYYLPKNATGAQEVGHVMTQSIWGFIPKTSNYALVIDEGFNYYIDAKRFYKTSMKDKLKALNQSQSVNMVSIINANNGNRINDVATGSHEVNESLISGAFVEFLIEEHGISDFSKLWEEATKSESANPNIFKIAYNKDLNQLNKEFLNILK